MWLPGRRQAIFVLLVAGVGAGATLLWMIPWRENGTSPATRPKEGRAIFEAHCAVCHGPMGKGDGPGATVIRQKMRDFGDAAAMRQVTDRFLFDIIKKGSSQFGRSNAMPAWGMKLTDAEIRALVLYIRSLGSQNPPASSGRKDKP